MTFETDTISCYCLPVTGRRSKTIQSFFRIDADTRAAVCCGSGSSSFTVTQATPELLDMAGQILGLRNSRLETAAPLALANGEHFTTFP